MCGIFGYNDSTGATLNERQLTDIGNSLKHRGPDHLGLHVWDRGAIANQRLSIIDVEHGNQPFVSDDGKVAVVQNGEIFNFIELADELKQKGVKFRTNSDTEVILRMYEAYGVDFVKRLNGMFAIAIHDSRDEKMILYRDRLGVKPLFVAEHGSRLLFASEIKAILKAGYPKKANQQALWHFLSFNYVPPPHTAFQGIEHLPPAACWVVRQGGIEKRTWWELPTDVSSRKLTDAQAQEEFREILRDAVRLRLRSDNPVGAFLSGGLDSSTVVSLMRSLKDDEIKTFTAGFDQPEFDESELAKVVSDRFRTTHFMRRLDVSLLKKWPKVTYYNDQPHGDVSFLPTLAVSELAAEHLRVVLTGDGGDELFAGYDKYVHFFGQYVPASEKIELKHLPKDFMKSYFESSSLFTHEEKLRLMNPKFFKENSAESSLHCCDDILAKTRDMDPVNQVLYFDTKMLLPGNNLVKPDRMGMACSLEARTPFLDYRMVEFAFGLPGSFKLKNGNAKAIMKDAIVPLVGQDVVDRKKRMFSVPLSVWLKEGFDTQLKELIFSPSLASRELFNTEEIARIYAEHESGRANHIRKIRAIAAIELWYRVFFDGMAI